MIEEGMIWFFGPNLGQGAMIFFGICTIIVCVGLIAKLFEEMFG